jgi:hypothetical protein
MPPQRDAVRAQPGARLPPILQGRPDPRLRRNMEAYAETHDVRGLMAELTQSIMVGMPEDPRRFLAVVICSANLSSSSSGLLTGSTGIVSSV